MHETDRKCPLFSTNSTGWPVSTTSRPSSASASTQIYAAWDTPVGGKPVIRRMPFALNGMHNLKRLRWPTSWKNRINYGGRNSFTTQLSENGVQRRSPANVCIMKSCLRLKQRSCCSQRRRYWCKARVHRHWEGAFSAAQLCLKVSHDSEKFTCTINWHNLCVQVGLMLIRARGLNSLRGRDRTRLSIYHRSMLPVFIQFCNR